MNNSNVSLKHILIVGLKRGVLYSAIFGFMTTGWLAMAFTIPSAYSDFDHTITGFIYFVIGSFGGSVMITFGAFIIFGLPILIIPSILGSGLLSYWLYCDYKNNQMTLPKSRLKGALLGSLAGFAAGWVFFYKDAIDPNPLNFFASNGFMGFIWGIGFFVMPFVFGGLAGILLGTYITKELYKGGSSPKSSEEYFKIDRDILQKEEQQEKNDLKSGTSSYDT